MVGAPARRLQVAYARGRGLSQRRACALLSTSRSSLHYESLLEARDKPLMAAMTDLAATYPRFGYRRINVFMERLGHVMGATSLSGFGSRPGCRCPGSAASQTSGDVPYETATTDGSKRTVAVRLCLRRLCKWSVDQKFNSGG